MNIFQGIGFVMPMENSNPMLERRPKPHRDRALNCPRCNSANTKFCYYNNYSFSQPRYFCKTCRRYWTEGGALRNVPVGGGSRKNKKSSYSSSKSPSPPAFSMNLADLNTPTAFPHSANPKNIIHGGQDLNLTYPPTDLQNYNSISKFIETPFKTENKTQIHHQATTSSSSMGPYSSFMAIASEETGVVSNGLLPHQESKPITLTFSLDGFHQDEYGNADQLQGSSSGNNNNGARLLFPVEEMKQQVPNTTTTTTADYFEQNNRGQGESTGYWTRLLSGYYQQ